MKTKRYVIALGISLMLLFVLTGRAIETQRRRALNEALIKEVARGDAARVSLLLHKGADPNTRDQAGWSALTQAKAGHHSEVARLLERAGGRE